MRKTMAYLTVVALVAMVLATVPVSVSAEYVGNVTILADGTVDPADAPISVMGMMYTLTDDISGMIRIKMSGITLDGAGYTVEGSGTGPGILAVGLTDLTIKGFNVKNFGNGIVLARCESSTVNDNTASGCYDSGIFLTNSNGNTVKDNKVHDNYWEGIWLQKASNNIIIDNEARNQNEGGIFLWYWSNNNLIKDNHLHENGDPTWGAGIFLSRYCDNNIIMDNEASNKNSVGIVLNIECNNNIVTENTILDSYAGGIYLKTDCMGNTITKNTIIKNSVYGQDGIRLLSSGDNTVSQNTISQYYRAVLVLWNPVGTSNAITENTFANNYKGIQLSYNSYDNQIHHNNFLHNDIQAQDHGIGNLFDDGSEGNYWSDYEGMDMDSDGIGDTPYLIDGAAGSQDNYPLMDPWEW